MLIACSLSAEITNIVLYGYIVHKGSGSHEDGNLPFNVAKFVGHIL